jgi:CheY-like chemotaxis protein
MGRKLLVADDSLTIQKVIKLALSSEGYDILAVSDGKEAIRAIQEERPDVVLIDVSLPVADAYQVKRAINENPKLKTVGFILMASAFERVDEKTIDEVQFHGRLIKPFDPSHLRKAVSDLMNKPAESFSAASPSIPPPPQVIENKNLNDDEFEESEDLPPVQDMHPTLVETPAGPDVTEEEFQLAPEKEESGFIIPPPPASISAPMITVNTPSDAEDEAQENVATQTLENDIKDLTESTIKMSGLDEFEWNLDDSKKMKSPPPSEMTKEIPRPPAIDRNKQSVKSIIGVPTRPIDDGGSNFPLHTAKNLSTQPHLQPKLKSPEIKPPPGSDLVSGRDYIAPTIELNEIEAVSAKPAQSSSSTYGSGATSTPLSRAEVEELLRKELGPVIASLAKELVPQIAEAMIRKELEKILAET